MATEKQLKIAPIFAWGGALLIMIGFIVGALILAPLASSYFGDNTKAVRDGAGADDSLTDDLVQLQSWARWLEPLLVLGVASLMFGIALEFSTIPGILTNRGKAMKAAFPKFTGGKQ